MKRKGICSVLTTLLLVLLMGSVEASGPVDRRLALDFMLGSGLCTEDELNSGVFDGLLREAERLHEANGGCIPHHEALNFLRLYQEPDKKRLASDIIGIPPEWVEKIPPRREVAGSISVLHVSERL